MSREISQPDASNRRSSEGAKGCWTDIGEAQVTHTIFGRARVRIIRRHDRLRRTLWLTVTATLVLAALAWQTWLPQQTETRQPDPVSTSDGEVGAMSSSAGIAKPVLPLQTAPIPSVAPAPSRPAAKPLSLGKAQAAAVVAAKPPVVQTLPKLSSPLAEDGKAGPSSAAVDQAAPTGQP